MNIGPTQAQIRKEIAEEEAKLSTEEGYIPLHDSTPSGFINEGLAIEEQQYIFDSAHILLFPLICCVPELAFVMKRLQ